MSRDEKGPVKKNPFPCVQEQVAKHLDGEGAEVRVGETVLAVAPPPLPPRQKEGRKRKERQQ